MNLRRYTPIGCRLLRKRGQTLRIATALTAIAVSPASTGWGPGSLIPASPVASPAAMVPTTSVLYEALSRCGLRLPAKERWRLAAAIEQESRVHGYDPLFVQALIETESGCRHTARSRRGAVGLTQLKPSTARAVASEAGVRWTGAEMLNRPVLNLRLGLRYLVQLERHFGDPLLAMAAYNLGPARVRRMERYRARDSRYVRKVLARYEGLLVEHAAKPS